MSDKENTNEQAQEPQTQEGPMVVHAQYIKDLSFENPNAIDNLRPGLEAPQMDVNVGLHMKKIDDKDVYEVTLHIEAKAMRGDQVIFIAEIDYAVIASVGNVPEQQHHPLLMIEAPKLAFPFARQILAEVTSQGGYPPVLLNPVDFEGLYIQQHQENQKRKDAEETEAASA